MAKKPVDVEDLMQWAAAELSRKRPGNVTQLPVLGSRADREIVGRWAWPMGYPSISPMFSAAYPSAGNARGDPPDDDAVIVEDAVTRLGLVKIGFSAEVVEDVRFGLGFELDAEAALKRGAGNVANLVLVHGRLCGRPSLRDETPKANPRLAPNGKPGAWRIEAWAEPTFDDHAECAHEHEVAVASLKKKDQYPPGAYGVLEWDPDPQAIVDERAEYWAWRAGLAWLAEALAGRLSKRAVLPPRAAERPWMGEADLAPLADPFGLAADRVYGADEAATMGAERGAARRRAVRGGGVYALAPERATRSANEK